MYYRSGVMELWAVVAGSGIARAQADVRLHELDQHSLGDGGYHRLLAYADGQSAARKDIVVPSATA